MQTIITQVLANAEPTMVDSGAGKSVVVMPLGEDNAWQETSYSSQESSERRASQQVGCRSAAD